MSVRNEHLEQAVTALDAALLRIARSRDCDYVYEKDRPVPCDCPVCTAKHTLALVKGWRYIGAMHDRVTNGLNPREAKMHAAWQKLIDDRHLSQILCEDTVPSVRDWYVATSVVQWLATNVGMTVLEAAGFKYDQWDQDRADRELMKRRLEREREPALKKETPP